MKTPLGAIELYNSLLSEMAHDDPERATFHEMIADQVHRLAQMADSVGSKGEQDAPHAQLHSAKALAPVPARRHAGALSAHVR